MKAAVLTVSDGVASGTREDRSGAAAARILEEAGFEVTERRVVPDGIDTVSAALREWVAAGVPLIVTTGGTGFGPRDLTPEGTRMVIDREAPGLGEAMRAVSLGANPHGMLSRAIAGIAGSSVVVNLPGSERGVEECLGAVAAALPHAVDLAMGRHRDQNASSHEPGNR